MQCASAILLSVACQALQNVSTLSHRRHNFRKKKLLSIKCVFRLSLQRSSETFLILKRNERDMTKAVYRSARKVPIILARSQRNLILSTDFRKML